MLRYKSCSAQLQQAQEALQVGAFDHVSGKVRLWFAGLNQVNNAKRCKLIILVNFEFVFGVRLLLLETAARTVHLAMAITTIPQASGRTHLIHRYIRTIKHEDAIAYGD